MATTPERLERRLLGAGLALESVGPDSLGLDLAADGPSLRPIEGVANLAQDLAVAMLTPLGSDPFNVAFGFDGLRVLTLGVSQPIAEELLRLAVIRTLSADGRVADVLDVRLMPLEPLHERRFRLEVDVRSVLNEALSLALGEVDLRG